SPAPHRRRAAAARASARPVRAPPAAGSAARCPACGAAAPPAKAPSNRNLHSALRPRTPAACARGPPPPAPLGSPRRRWRGRALAAPAPRRPGAPAGRTRSARRPAWPRPAHQPPNRAPPPTRRAWPPEPATCEDHVAGRLHRARSAPHGGRRQDAASFHLRERRRVLREDALDHFLHFRRIQAPIGAPRAVAAPPYLVLLGVDEVDGHLHFVVLGDGRAVRHTEAAPGATVARPVAVVAVVDR